MCLVLCAASPLRAGYELVAGEEGAALVRGAVEGAAPVTLFEEAIDRRLELMVPPEILWNYMADQLDGSVLEDVRPATQVAAFSRLRGSEVAGARLLDLLRELDLMGILGRASWWPESALASLPPSDQLMQLADSFFTEMSEPQAARRGAGMAGVMGLAMSSPRFEAGSFFAEHAAAMVLMLTIAVLGVRRRRA